MPRVETKTTPKIPQQLQAFRIAKAFGLRRSGETTPTMEDCEPRTRLLWSIVGQASSLDWKHTGAPAAPPPPTPHHLPPPPTAVATAASPNPTGTVEEEGVCSEAPSAETQGEGGGPREAVAGMGVPLRGDRGFWADLQPELMFLVTTKLASAGAVQAMVAVCT